MIVFCKILYTTEFVESNWVLTNRQCCQFWYSRSQLASRNKKFHLSVADVVDLVSIQNFYLISGESAWCLDDVTELSTDAVH